MAMIYHLLKEFPVTCVYGTGRIDCGRSAPGCEENRKKVCDAAGVEPGSLVFPEQKHGAGISVVSGSDRGGFMPHCDGLVTREKSLPLAVLTADCLPIFLYDPEKGCVGIGHAGWKGTREGIAAGLVRSMEKEFGSAASSLHVVFGPSIRVCCYEVGEKFKTYFPDSVIARDQKYYFDLAGENKRQLVGCGVDASNILDSGTCTCCPGDEFFSYRREGKNTGRTLSIIQIRLS